MNGKHYSSIKGCIVWSYEGGGGVYGLSFLEQKTLKLLCNCPFKRRLSVGYVLPCLMDSIRHERIHFPGSLSAQPPRRFTDSILRTETQSFTHIETLPQLRRRVVHTSLGKEFSFSPFTELRNRRGHCR